MRNILILATLLALPGCASTPAWEAIAYSDVNKMDAMDRCVQDHAFDNAWVGDKDGPVGACNMVPWFNERRKRDAVKHPPAIKPSQSFDAIMDRARQPGI